MKKSIKLENDFYWDANGIIHNKETLATFIQNYKNRVFLAYKAMQMLMILIISTLQEFML